MLNKCYIYIKINLLKRLNMKYFLCIVGVSLLLSSCSMSHQCSSYVDSSQQITVFTPDGIVYVNDGF
jgi:hypothetical protein